jgi:hypothetical protein
MTAVNAGDLRGLLENVKRAVPEPTWDFVVYARFLAARLPATGPVAAGELARVAEELLGELKEGLDKRSGGVFEPPLVSGRADLLYNHFRTKLGAVAAVAGGSDYATAVTATLRPVLPAARPPAAEPKAEPRAAPAPAASAPAAAASDAPAPA